jgi:hypothetical protein
VADAIFLGARGLNHGKRWNRSFGRGESRALFRGTGAGQRVSCGVIASRRK